METRVPAKKIGEVIEASTTEFVAECYALHEAPPLGALLRAGDGSVDLYGVACFARTGSIDPGRRPIARGREDEDEDEVYRRHPELPQLLRTEFKVLVLGYRDNGFIHHYLPPRPPRLHGFVYECEQEEVIAFTDRLECLRTLLAATPPSPADDLVAAFLRRASAARIEQGADGRAFLVASGKELARSLAGDPQRLGSILLRMRG